MQTQSKNVGIIPINWYGVTSLLVSLLCHSFFFFLFVRSVAFTKPIVCAFFFVHSLPLLLTFHTFTHQCESGCESEWNKAIVFLVTRISSLRTAIFIFVSGFWFSVCHWFLVLCVPYARTMQCRWYTNNSKCAKFIIYRSRLVFDCWKSSVNFMLLFGTFILFNSFSLSFSHLPDFCGICFILSNVFFLNVCLHWALRMPNQNHSVTVHRIFSIGTKRKKHTPIKWYGIWLGGFVVALPCFSIRANQLQQLRIGA